MLGLQEISADSIKRGKSVSPLLMYFIFCGTGVIANTVIYSLLGGSSLVEVMPLLVKIIRIVKGGLTLICGVAAWKWKRGAFGVSVQLLGPISSSVSAYWMPSRLSSYWY